MGYIVHKRKTIGNQIHETLGDKNDSKKEREERLNEMDSSLTETRTELEKEKVESEYLTPEVKNWVETDSVKSVKKRVKNWLSLKYPIHIIGPTGCGKTILALQVAKELGRPVVWINGDESVTTTDLIGGYSQVETTSLRDKYVHNVFKDKDILKAQWVDNPLTLACKYGYTLVYNEFSRSKAAANNVLLSIFSEGILELPTQFGEERYVKVHPEFRVIFTSNSAEYAGIHQPQDALLDRMVGIHMDYYDHETETKIIASQAGIKENQASPIVDMLSSLRKRSSLGNHIGTRAGVMVAQALKSINNFDKAATKQMLMDVISSKAKNREHFQEQQKIIEKL